MVRKHVNGGGDNTAAQLGLFAVPLSIFLTILGLEMALLPSAWRPWIGVLALGAFGVVAPVIVWRNEDRGAAAWAAGIVAGVYAATLVVTIALMLESADVGGMS